MRVRKFKNKKLSKYLIVNDSGWTRSGFYHKSTLVLNDNCELQDNKINYINRTWECYTFQTCMIALIRKYRKHIEDSHLKTFKYDNNITRMTAKYKKLFEEHLNKVDAIKECNMMIAELEQYHC